MDRNQTTAHSLWMWMAPAHLLVLLALPRVISSAEQVTWEVSEALWTIEKDHRVLAIARNPQMTYVLLNVLDQNTMEPFVHEIHCWGWLGNIIPGWPDLKDDGAHDFEGLQTIIPPDPPEEEPASPVEDEPAPELVCQISLDSENCKKTGGTYEPKTGVCSCP